MNGWILHRFLSDARARRRKVSEACIHVVQVRLYKYICKRNNMTCQNNMSVRRLQEGETMRKPVQRIWSFYLGIPRCGFAVRSRNGIVLSVQSHAFSMTAVWKTAHRFHRERPRQEPRISPGSRATEGKYYPCKRVQKVKAFYFHLCIKKKVDGLIKNSFRRLKTFVDQGEEVRNKRLS